MIGVVKSPKILIGDQVPEYGLEALVSTIEDRDELISAIKAARTHQD